MRSLPALALSLAAAFGAQAEYRVALVFGDRSTDAAVRSLEMHGFQCVTSEMLPEKELRRKIESWASRTPTNSTALVHFSGDVRKASHGGKPAVCLIATSGHVPVPVVFEYLGKRGGSRRNLLVASESSEEPEPVAELPDGCALSYRDIPSALREAGVSGRGSAAISTPEAFVPGRKAGDEWVNAQGMVFCWCPPGSFVAGSPEGTPGRYPDEEPRKVVIKDGFWIGKYEHTRGQKLRNLSSHSMGTLKNHPIERLHWDDGRNMLKNLTGSERAAGRLPEGWEYAMPDSDQWEYAARAGTATLYYFGNAVELLPQHANFADKAFYDSGDIYSNHAHRTLDDGFAKLAPVGSLKPNPWGLHDVYGNVYEWCRDQSARGGSWVTVAENCRSAYRDRYASRDDQTYLGYRFVIQRNVPEPVKKR